MFEWDESYATGIADIDEQHMKLFEIGNRAYNLLKNSLVLDKYDKIVDIIVELKDYTKYHFKYEEDYLASIKYKKFFSHKIMHEEFIGKLNSIDLEHVDVNQDDSIIGILSMLQEWLADHILEKDQAYVAAT